MTSFDKRRNKGQQLEDYFINYLQENGIEYLLTGYENLQASGKALEVLHSIKEDKTTNFIRYYPDVLVITRNGKNDNVSCLVDVKNSSGIEKECYNNYFTLKEKLDIEILLFLKNKKICTIRELRFNSMSEYDKIANMNIPVDNGIWKEPRTMSKEDYYKYLNAYSNAERYTSGCSFAFIDFENTKFYELSILRS